MNQTKLNSVLKELNELTGLTLNPEAIQTDDLDYSISQLRSICSAYKEKYDKTYFLRNILHGEISDHSICQQARTFRIPVESPRALFLLETKYAMDDTVLTVLRYMFSDQGDSYIIPLADNQAVILYPYKADRSYREQIVELTHIIIDTLNTEVLVSAKIACGPAVCHLTQLSQSFEKAVTTLNIGKRFHLEQDIFFYDQLGIERIIYHLPNSLCEDFLNEVWKNNIPHVLDSELINMINCFLNNNLNIAETARQLHMHRNTLIYRIEKIQSQTDLDIRHFEDAMTLKLALMIMNKERNSI